MTFRQVMSNDLNPYETLGYLEESILSSILSFHRAGADLKAILMMKEQIGGIVSTLWGLIPTALNSNENEKYAAMFEELKIQLNREVSRLLEAIETLRENT